MVDSVVRKAMAYLAFDSISKEFPGVKALSDVSFGVREGSVHALVGENGAGKSTLLKILSGAHPASEGRLLLGGEPTEFSSTGQALAAGVAVIYQELHLIEHMSVAENLYLGHLPARAGVVTRRKLRAQALEQLKALGEEIDPDAPLSSLSIAQRQMIEIAKALTRGAKVIAFDEPTSSLSEREIRRLFEIISDLKAKGHVILYVSHRMEEIFEMCDAVTVLRDGCHIETFDTMAGLDQDTLIARMVGRDIQDIYGYTPRETGATMALEARGLEGPGLAAPASLSVAKGEIVGMFGLVGAGRSELLRLIYGAERPRNGSVQIEGETLKTGSPSAAIRAGLVFCPEDRKKEGILAIRSVAENINISARRRNSHPGGVLRSTWERMNARKRIEQLRVKTPSPRQAIVNLSGGNQQKVILGRWLSEPVRAILLDEPTRGIDVGAKSEIYRIMYDLAARGVGVLMVSSDLPEVLGVADRIVVMREGRIVASLARGEADEHKVLKLALPTTSEAAAV